MLLIEKFEIVIMNADFKRQTDFCNQKEANRQGRQIKQNSIKVIQDIEKWNKKKSLKGILKESPLKKKMNLLKEKYTVVIGKFHIVIVTWKYILFKILDLEGKKFLGHPGRKMNHLKSVRKSG